MLAIKLNPITRKRLRRFREMKRAYWSFRALVVLYAISLCAELVCNSVPLVVRYNERTLFPVFRFYPEDAFTGNGNLTRPDYRDIEESEAFRTAPGSFMIWPLIPSGPNQVLDPDRLIFRQRVTVRIRPEPVVGSVSVDPDWIIVRSRAASWFFDGLEGGALPGRKLTDFYEIQPAIVQAAGARFRNLPTGKVVAACSRRNGLGQAEFSLVAFKPRRRPPSRVKIILRRRVPETAREYTFRLERNGEPGETDREEWLRIPPQARTPIREAARRRFEEPVEPLRIDLDGVPCLAEFEVEVVRFPFRPLKGHWLGIDDAGRDVLARILYGLRTSMTFGLILVVCSLCIGTVLGSIQGYAGGWLDITGQRLVEIWSALPFLYVMILMGSVYGRSFALLILCYGLFNWIGISYYMRAEMLRLRKQPFVEAARCLGLPGWKIVLKHILPNALIPLITLFPFSLVGAIGSLAALDYLGFGLPPPTAS